MRSLARSYSRSQDFTAAARDTLAKCLAKMADRSRVAMAKTGMRAFEYCHDLTDSELHERDRAIALQNHAKNLQLAHMWFPQTQALNVGVQVNVPLPDKTERDEMRAIDRRLDELAKRLKP